MHRQAAAIAAGAPVLPDDSVIHRQAGFFVPDQSGFPLVGDPHMFNGKLEIAGNGQRFTGHIQYRQPEFLRILLYPAVFGVILWKLPLRGVENFKLVVK